eukprot:8177110-Alexandrium_andersonii.AAC.1
MRSELHRAPALSPPDWMQAVSPDRHPRARTRKPRRAGTPPTAEFSASRARHEWPCCSVPIPLLLPQMPGPRSAS